MAASLVAQRSSYFEHGADVGVEGRGATVEEALVAAARAVFALTTRLEDVRALERIDVAFTEREFDFALVAWLNGLLARSNERGLALGRFDLGRDGARWHGVAWGERWREGLERGTDVKGATLTMLSVRREGEEWVARCVVDV